ncbi:hypothetical protein SAMN05660226_03138 [Parapedobacter luteus]|uniref:ATP-grasp domain-containing protein n=1 Tax=Parapedobacter luteus TaxID=623280 RepID=A0A1T5E424_9SPHI|nr:hypothetical protein [Parapedobacter luteus]SKB78604.1 hypothetical protein SAMN05660226_03138 [Parapedobacter luteus]
MHLKATTTIRDSWTWPIRNFFIKLANWEYWPAPVFYLPIGWYWIWISIRARTPFFFSAANPRIPYSGFTLAPKDEIYRLLPAHCYPKTLLIAAGTDVHTLEQSLNDNGLHFPLIAKPNIGDRGVQVKILESSTDLHHYAAASKVNFLIQEFIDYDHEIGIFYYRVPGEKRGRISGIVGKEYLTVTGDGTSSIEALLTVKNRYIIQLPRLKATYGKKLDTVLQRGAKYTLPYGSHCRGALFRDVSDKINDKLLNVIDDICQRIPKFHYGRMDVKFKGWDELNQGKNFSIIELNGAASEPAHIYDPKHSVFFAWKEVCRHWQLLYKISKANSKKEGVALMRFNDGIKMLNDHFKIRRLMK